MEFISRARKQGYVSGYFPLSETGSLCNFPALYEQESRKVGMWTAMEI